MLSSIGAGIVGLWNKIGRRGTCLLVFAFLDFVFAYSYLEPLAEYKRTAFTLFIGALAPLWFWGLLWLVVGIACLVSAFMRADRWGFAGAAGIKVLWGVLYLIAAFASVPRAWLGAALWLAIAGWVGVISTWPERTVKGGQLWTPRR